MLALVLPTPVPFHRRASPPSSASRLAAPPPPGLLAAPAGAGAVRKNRQRSERGGRGEHHTTHEDGGIMPCSPRASSGNPLRHPRKVRSRDEYHASKQTQHVVHEETWATGTTRLPTPASHSSSPSKHRGEEGPQLPRNNSVPRTVVPRPASTTCGRYGVGRDRSNTKGENPREIAASGKLPRALTCAGALPPQLPLPDEGPEAGALPAAAAGG